MERRKRTAARLRQAREEAGLSQKELGRLYGCTGVAISQYERAIRNLGIPALERFALILRKPIEWFLTDEVPLSEPVPRRPLDFILKEAQEAYEALETVVVPIRGSVPAGYPDVKKERIEDYEDIPREKLGVVSRKIYALRMSGQSLIGDGIHDGDLVVVEPGPDVTNGKIHVVRLGNEVVLLHVFKEGEGYCLVSSNAHYEVIRPPKIEILGRVILAGHWNKF